MKLYRYKVPLVALALLAGGTMNALADVKTGVDAWAQGDYERAVSEWRPLAKAGDADAQFNMGQAYKLGRGVPANLATALDYYRMAALQGHDRATDNYGLLLFQQNRRIEAMPYIEQSAERGEPRAQYLLGVALFNGDLKPKNWPRAYAMMLRAQKGNLPQAVASLAQMEKYLSETNKAQGRALAAQMEGQGQATKPATEPFPTLTAPASPAVRPAKPSPAVTAPATGKSSGPAPVSTAAPEKAASGPITSSTEPLSSPSQPKQERPTQTRSAEVRPAEAKPAQIKPAKGKWRIQLGAYSTTARAETQWKKLCAQVSGLADHSYFLEKNGPIVRLQAGPFASQADALRICNRVKAAGGECMVKAV